jgi:hypothetical protein
MAFVSRHASPFARWLGLSALALIAGTSTAALAGPPAGKIEPKSTARSQADLGYELFEAGHYVEAAQAFRLAEGIFHAPTLVFAIGRAESKSGHLLEARELFRRVIAEKLPPTAPHEFVGAQEAARAELAVVEARIPHVVITVNGAAGRSFGVRLDDVDVELSALSQPIDVDPGAHRVVVTPDAGADEKRTVTLVEGAREAVTIDLPAAPTKAVAPVRAPVAVTPQRDLLVPALASLGVGAVGIGIGAALGGLTLAKTSAIRKHCDGDVCPRDQKSAADGARTTATISTVGFIVGGVFAATGVTLLVLRPKPQKPAIGLVIGPGTFIAQGTF